MTCKYFVDKDGNYLGAFDGYRPVVDDVREIPVTKVLPVTTKEGKELLDSNGNPFMETVHYTVKRVVGVKRLAKVYPELPDGIEVANPPRHGQDTYDHETGEWIDRYGKRYGAGQ